MENFWNMEKMVMGKTRKITCIIKLCKVENSAII